MTQTLVAERRDLPDLPKSFQDSGARGTGDLKGSWPASTISSETLGVDALWLTPVYVSPGRQRLRHRRLPGHRPAYGTMSDFRGAAGRRPCAQYSHRDGHRRQPHLHRGTPGSSRRWGQEHPYRDATTSGKTAGRYVPNNWQSKFGGGSAKTGQRRHGQYYLHLFAREQADLNWEPGGACRGEGSSHFWAKGRRFPPRRHQPHLQGSAL